MYLKSLQIIGFKSFADKTQLDFLPGVTAIVGPNGCGKSNVSDAIRWVLGEQSAKALRGGEMADVIFNGTDTRKAFGMAEVSLTFTECGDVLKTGQLAGIDTNFDEVTVTRRIFRDGNSEYLINKVPCRLKDVHSLFMDTGVGRSSYSIMEQGKIDKILSSHPEDRRAIFEEAAGITKFKTQKKEALRKLEYTEANLVRVADIIREVKRQIGSLQRQVSKARRFQNFMIEIKHLDTQLGRHEYESIESTIRSLEKETEEVKIRLEDLRIEIEAGEGNVTNLRSQVDAAEHERQQILERQRDIQSEIERYETRIRTNTDRISETEASIQAAEQSGSEARTRLVDVQAQLATTRLDIDASREKLAGQKIELDQAQASFQESESLEREHSERIHAFQATLLNLEGTLANLRNQTTTLERQRQEFSAREQKLSEARTLAHDEKQKAAQKLESLQTEISSYKHTFEASRHAVIGGEGALLEAEAQCQNLSTRIAEEQRMLSQKTSRRDVLRQLQDSYEGYSEGAQALLRQATDASITADQNASTQAILGTLANLIEVEATYSAAIEAGLGQSLQSIVVSDSQKALGLVEELRSRELGRAWFALKPEETPSHMLTGLEREPILGAICWASSVVKPQAAVEQFVSQLLADTVIVADLTTALELRKNHSGITFVTVEGDVLDHHGILSAGSRKAMPMQLIGRRNEIAVLDFDITSLETRLHELSASKGEWEGRRALARQSLGDRQSELRLQENDLTKKEALLSGLQSELREVDNRVSTTELELQELDRRGRQNESDSVRVRHELGQAEELQVKAQADVGLARQRSEELAAERHHRSVRANDLRVICATVEQHLRGLTSQIEPMERQLTETQQFVVAREADAQSGRQRIVQWQGDCAEATNQIQGLQESAFGIAGQIASVEKEKSRLDTEIHGAIESVRRFRQSIEELQKQLTDHEVRLTEKRGDVSHLTERIQREYQVDLATVLPLPLEADAPSQEEPKAESVPLEEAFPVQENASDAAVGTEDAEIAAPPMPITDTFLKYANWDDVALRVAELRTKIQGMGPVNMEAVQEFEELQQRFSFLNREHDDLVLSKTQLMEILQKINGTTQKMFAETFETIRQNFQGVFTELFGGGKADLVLLDEADPLECGIDIVAKPPGKQLQSILLLSGGERTMTAVSLLFAIYMVKPSPFCVLDEMDAPLDESNINRFIKMLERFLVHSQFVIITHNKRTIGMADGLYGVTMEERGVSKVVSVKFNKKEKTRAANGASEPSAEASDPEPASRSRLLVDVPTLEQEDMSR